MVRDVSWHAETIVASWAIPKMQAQHTVDVIPLYPARQTVITWPEGTTVKDPAVGGGAWVRHKRTADAFRGALATYDVLIVGQDFDLELLLADSLPSTGTRAVVVLLAQTPLTPTILARTDKAGVRLRHQVERLYPCFDGIITLTDAMADELVYQQGLAGEKILSWPMPLPTAGELACSLPWPFPEDDVPVIASVGTLAHVKGIEVLLNAVKMLQDQRHLACRVLVIGDGPERERQETLARALDIETSFVGWVPQPGAWLKRATLLVAPQFLDGTGWDLWLAMHAGVAVLAADSPVVAGEVLSHGTVGRLVEAGNTMAMADELETLLVDVRLRENLALKGRQRAQEIATQGAVWSTSLAVDGTPHGSNG